jgi:RNA recognition motif-containing protein
MGNVPYAAFVREQSRGELASTLFLSFLFMSHSLFIGGLSWDTTEQALAQHLSAVAPVVSVKIPKDRLTGKPRGFAFVDMQSVEGARQVIAELHERELDGRSLRIDAAREEGGTEPRKLYVAGLSDSVTEDSLRAHLASAGSVTGVSIVLDRDTGRPRGFAFVDTASEEDSESIIASCHDSMFEGKSILVRKSRPKSEKPRASFGRNR